MPIRERIAPNKPKSGKTLSTTPDADEQINFRADRLGDGREALGGNVLGADQAHGRLHQDFRNLTQLLGARLEIGHDPHDDDRESEQGHGRHKLRQGLLGDHG